MFEKVEAEDIFLQWLSLYLEKWPDQSSQSPWDQCADKLVQKPRTLEHPCSTTIITSVMGRKFVYHNIYQIDLLQLSPRAYMGLGENTQQDEKFH